MMKKKGARTYFSPLVVLLFWGMACLMLTSCSASMADSKTGTPGVIFIDSCAAFGDLERPTVAFPHDLHTAALSSLDDVCGRCHGTVGEGKLSFKYLGTEKADKQTLVNRYHDDCVGCHRDTAKAGEKSGPVTCGECHTRQPKWDALRYPTQFMAAQHEAHMEANECADCHHIYDAEAKTLTYVEGEERGCHECHGAKGTDQVPSIEDAAHGSCIGCHREYELTTTCSGCHSAKEVTARGDGERIPGNQPDFVLVHAADGELDSSQLRTVPFDHAAHEKVTDSCRACHHKNLSRCSSCHSLAGSKKGGNVGLQQAMHDVTVGFSCVGCHNRAKKEASCAGCHELMEQGRVSEHSCQICHQGPLPSEIPETDTSAMTMAQFRASEISMTFASDDIPEDVTIGTLSKRFEPVEFPHGVHVERLRSDIAESAMATHFHGHEDAVCQGCHHHTPIGAKPPKCGNCHGQPFNTSDPFRPGLLAAYHLQCNECHRNMDIMDASDCEVCHAKKE